MTDFLIGLFVLSLTVSCIALAVFLLFSMLGRRLSAKCRYIVWALILLRLCIPFRFTSIPAIFTLDIALMPSENSEIEVGEDISGGRDVFFEVDGKADADFSDIEDAPSKETGSPSETNFPGDETAPYDIPQTPAHAPVIDGSSHMPLEPVTYGNDGKISSDMIFTALFTVWAVGAAIFFTVNTVSSYIGVLKYEKSKRLCDKRTAEIYADVCAEQGLKKYPKLYCSDLAESPMLVGYFDPKIYIPSINTDEIPLHGILVHEIIHYKRRDLWVKLLCLAARSLNWFNPVAHFAVKRCNAEMELSCDEAVLSGLNEEERRAYGNAMLGMIKLCRSRRGTLTTGFNPNKNAVKERLMSILDMSKKSRGIWIIAAVLILCVLSGAIIGYNLNGKNGTDGDTSDKNTDNVDIASGEVFEDVLFSVGGDVKVLDASVFYNVDAQKITEIMIGKNVESVDFVFLNSMSSLRKITLGGNTRFSYITLSEKYGGGAVFISSDTNEMLYFTGNDHTLDMRDTSIGDAFKTGAAIKVHCAGGELEMRCVHGADEDDWVVSRLMKGEMEADIGDELRTGEGKSFRAFRSEDMFVFSHDFYLWSRSYIFTKNRIIDENSWALSYKYGIDALSEIDSVRYYPGENGSLGYEHVGSEFCTEGNDARLLNGLWSREALWREIGTAEIGDDGAVIYHAEKRYTADDYFASKGTDIDSWFDGLAKESRKGAKTLDEFLDGNIPSLEFASSYSNIKYLSDFYSTDADFGKYEKAKANVKNGAYEGYALKGQLESDKGDLWLYYDMSLPQLTYEKPTASMLNGFVRDKYFHIWQDALQVYENLGNNEKRALIGELVVDFDTYTYGSVLILSVRARMQNIKANEEADEYDIFYYDTRNDSLLTLDEFIRLYTEGRETLATLLRELNDFSEVVNSGDGSYLIDESRVCGLIPAEKGCYILFYGSCHTPDMALVLLKSDEGYKEVYFAQNEREYDLYIGLMRRLIPIDEFFAEREESEEFVKLTNKLISALNEDKSISNIISGTDPDGSVDRDMCDYISSLKIHIDGVKRADMPGLHDPEQYNNLKFTLALDEEKNYVISIYFGISATYGGNAEPFVKDIDVAFSDKVLAEYRKAFYGKNEDRAETIPELRRILGENDNRFKYIEALVTGDTKTLEEVCFVGNGAYEGYKNLHISKWTADIGNDTVGQKVVYFRFCVDGNPGILNLPESGWSDTYIVYEGIRGVELQNVNGEAELGGAESDAAKALARYFKFGPYDFRAPSTWDNFGYVCYICNTYGTNDGLTEAEMKSYAEKCFGFVNFIPGDSHKYNGMYTELGHGGSGVCFEIISEASTEENRTEVTVRFYADASMTVESCVCRYTVTKHEGYYRFGSFEKISDSGLPICSWGL